MNKIKQVHGLPAYNIPLNENQIGTILRALNNPDVVLHPEYGERALEVRNYINNQKKMKDDTQTY